MFSNRISIQGDDLEETPERIQNVIMKTKLVKINTHATLGINKYKLSWRNEVGYTRGTAWDFRRRMWMVNLRFTIYCYCFSQKCQCPRWARALRGMTSFHWSLLMLILASVVRGTCYREPPLLLPGPQYQIQGNSLNMGQAEPDRAQSIHCQPADLWERNKCFLF